MTLSPLALLSALVMTAGLVFAAPASAGTLRSTFTVSAQVTDSCQVELDGHATNAAPAAVHASCANGGSSVGGIAADGAVTTSGTRPFRVTTVRTTTSASEGSMVVTLSF